MSVVAWLAGVASKYGAIAFGVVLGFLARYADLLSQGKDVTRRIVLMDLLIFGMVTAIATAVAELAHMPAIVRTPFGSACGFSGMWLCQFVGRRFRKNAGATIGRVLPAIGGDDA